MAALRLAIYGAFENESMFSGPNRESFGLTIRCRFGGFSACTYTIGCVSGKSDWKKTAAAKALLFESIQKFDLCFRFHANSDWGSLVNIRECDGDSDAIAGVTFDIARR
jgi:hypothetical protein